MRKSPLALPYEMQTGDLASLFNTGDPKGLVVIRSVFVICRDYAPNGRLLGYRIDTSSEYPVALANAYIAQAFHRLAVLHKVCELIAIDRYALYVRAW